MRARDHALGERKGIISSWVEEMIRNMGYWGLALMTFLEKVFPPIPSEVIMPLGGSLVAQGQLHIVGVILAVVAGSVAGAVVLYYVGHLVKQERLVRWVDRHGKWLLLTKSDVEGAFGWFEQHGSKAVFFCRLIPAVRSLISIPAGACGMSLGPFLLYTVMGTAIWSSVLAVAGMILGQQYQSLSAVLRWASYAVLALLVLSVGWYIVQRRRELSRES